MFLAIIDDNTTLIVLALISAFGVMVNTVVAFLSLRYTTKSNTKIDAVVHAVNGMTQARVDAATTAGDVRVASERSEGNVRAEVARAAGIAEERDRVQTPAKE